MPIVCRWLGIWYSIAVAEMIVVKQIVTNVDMTTWGRTYYMVSRRVARKYNIQQLNLLLTSSQLFVLRDTN